MMYTDAITRHAEANPAKAALVFGPTGESESYEQLERITNQGAHMLRSLGLKPGDRVAICLENGFEVIHIGWSALRSGLIIVPISSKLTASEISFIVRDSGARLLISSPSIGEGFFKLQDMLPEIDLFTTDDVTSGFRSWTTERANFPSIPVPDEAIGSEMLYSSGTTGQPKGIDYGTDASVGGVGTKTLQFFDAIGVDSSMIYLSAAPLYHSAPFCWALGTVRRGGTVIIMDRFDAEEALKLIQRYHVTISQWVPTHFVRMLKLPENIRRSYDMSSLKVAAHAAAPCPPEIKEAMIDWWGPILLEYFGSSEQGFLTIISSTEALTHRGSVGRGVGSEIHICDDNGEPLPSGEVGQIYANGGNNFRYHNDEEKTVASRNRYGWTTVGDMGYLDDDGYLYLADRKSFMIISGGVNIYPQEIENLLVTHPRIYDAAVIGLPDLEMGEKVTAIIQPMDMADATPSFVDELTSWMRETLSSVKLPKRIEFCEELPRLPTGKVVKHKLKEAYIGQAEARASGLTG